LKNSLKSFGWVLEGRSTLNHSAKSAMLILPVKNVGLFEPIWCPLGSSLRWSSNVFNYKESSDHVDQENRHYISKIDVFD
jgi:hypothetical protein